MKKKIWFILRKMRISDLFHLKIQSYLKDMGWFKSYYNQMPIDHRNRPIPWFTYPFIQFIEPRLKKDFNVFEYGSGNSSIWFSERVKKITSLEHNKEWYDLISNKMSDNITLLFKEVTPDGDYAKTACDTNELYNIIIVDGRDRVNCVKRSVKALSSDGVLIFDNSNVEDYADAMIFLKNNQFRRIDFYGMGPIAWHTCCTSVFYRERNCLDI